jgi:DmsE family decaheme c-type cytochrome
MVWAALGICAAYVVVTVADAAEDDRTCLRCHNLKTWPQVHEIFATPHGVAADARTPEGGAGCASCHGDGSEHRRKSKEVAPEIGFGPRHVSAPEVQNGACLGCHAAAMPHWQGGSHAREDLSCTACHQIHSRDRAVQVRTTQAGVCYQCHRDVRAEVNLPSRHPIREAEMVCTDCHNAHGTLKAADLLGINPTETCLGCHQELRGPFLFDHPPASDDCGTCHRPHGSVHEPLLVARGPQLCQECHLAAFHPSDLNAGGGLPGGMPNPALLGRDCMNCHPKIHGTNHPSGARLTR